MNKEKFKRELEIAKEKNRLVDTLFKISWLLVLMSLIILICGLCSASPVEITPNKISISGYPGESIEQNITIKTEGNYVVYFNTTNENITITPNMSVVEKELNTTIKITFSKDIPKGIYNFQVQGTTDYPEKIVTITSSSSSGSSGGGCSTYQKNKIINETINKSSVIENCSSENYCLIGKYDKYIDELNEKAKISNKNELYLFFIVVVFLFLIIIVFRYTNKINKYKNEYG